MGNQITTGPDFLGLGLDVAPTAAHYAYTRHQQYAASYFIFQNPLSYLHHK